MGQKIRPEAQARETAALAINKSKRKFDVQNKRVGMLMFENEARYALQILSNNKMLLKCEPSTITDSMVHLAAMGLSLNPAAQQAALIPRWNTKANRYDCTASPQYRGLMKLATDTGLVTNITAEVVFECEEDSFDVDLGSNPYLKHKPKLFATPRERLIDLKDEETNKLIGSYCIAHLRDSDKPHITIMDLSEVLSIAQASDAFNPRKQGRAPSGPWVYWAGEMVKKAVIRRASKQWPLSDDSKYQQLLTAIEVDNLAEANEQRTEVRSEQIEGEMGENLTPEQVEIVTDLCSTQNLSPEKVFGNYNVNALSKIQQKHFGEIHEKLLDRQRKFNAAQQEGSEVSTEAPEEVAVPSKNEKSKPTDKE